MKIKAESFNKSIKTPKLCWLFLIVSLGINMISIDVYLPSMPKMTEDLSTTAFILKLVFIINFLEFSLAPILWGTFADLRGRKLAIINCLILSITGQLISAIASNGYLLMFGRIIQFLGAGALSSIILTLICDNFEGDKRAKAIALYEFSLPLTVICGPLIGISLSEYMGWRATFLFLALLQTISFIGIYLTFSETLRIRRNVQIIDALKSIMEIFKNPVVIRIILILGISEGAWMIYIISSSFFYLQTFKVSANLYIYYQSIATISFLVGVLSYRIIINKISILKCFNIGVAGYGIFGLGVFFYSISYIIPTPINLCILISFMNYCCGIISSGGNAIAFNHVDKKFIGTSAATITSMINIIVGGAMLLGNYIIDSKPTITFFLCLLASAVIIVVLWVTIQKLDRII